MGRSFFFLMMRFVRVWEDILVYADDPYSRTSAPTDQEEEGFF